jgi:hypothetical protein
MEDSERVETGNMRKKTVLSQAGFFTFEDKWWLKRSGPARRSVPINQVCVPSWL